MFKPGDIVLCVDSQPTAMQIAHPSWAPQMLTEGEIYEVVDVYPATPAKFTTVLVYHPHAARALPPWRVTRFVKLGTVRGA